ncbi:MAG: hypothetical protein VB108_07730 [Anaerolineaceae bacterium]|nr:hypothetical protein [Anaerolineaceae bacterium]
MQKYELGNKYCIPLVQLADNSSDKGNSMKIEQVSLLLLIIWFIVFVLGKMQLASIKSKMLLKINNALDALPANKPQASLDELYQNLFFDWKALVKSNAFYVLDKNELLPRRANPDFVLKRLNFSKPWLGAYASLRGVDLKMSSEDRSLVSDILNLRPPHKSHGSLFAQGKGDKEKTQKVI